MTKTFEKAMKELHAALDKAGAETEKLKNCREHDLNKLAKITEFAVQKFKAGHFGGALVELDRVHALSRLIALALQSDNPEKALKDIEPTLSAVDSDLMALAEVSNHYDKYPALTLK